MYRLLMRHLRIVTPHAGVWIEIPTRPKRRREKPVTPHAGVWIEITMKVT